ncbi:MAG TPA: gluconate 2-dehydrogenase subunit 3 family protein [Chitinophagaceae bacterium]|nr:gluconate 2-dehydrogenase subunit 3 family protein [Chitinophagaceae bacterium]
MPDWNYIYNIQRNNNMSITRRHAVKQIIIISGGVVLFPSCVHHEDKTSIPLKNVDLNAGHEKLLAEIAETIIPATNNLGAKDVYTHIYTLKMLDDCTEKEKQDAFVKGLNEINTISKNKFNNKFIDCTVPQREAILTYIESKKVDSKDVQSFYGMMKHFTIQGYMTSKYVGTKLVVYELVPGRFHGTFPIKNKI